MGAVGGIFAVIFGILWTVLAVAMTRSMPFPFVGIVFPLFGVIFVVIGIASVVYNLYNAGAKNRLSVLDVTSGTEEPDPLNSAAVGPQASGSVESRLKKLGDLKASGLISEAEFRDQRKRILGEI